jgi:NAD+ kinase
MKRIGIVAKIKQDKHVHRTLQDLVEWLTARKIQPILDLETGSHLNYPHCLPKAELPEATQLLVVLGGDGTLLSMARLIKGRDVPILGVNIGGLGFLSEVTIEEMLPVLDKVLKGECRIDRRMMLHAQVFRQGTCITEESLLNDVVINKSALARILTLEVKVGGDYLTTFQADGLIVSTPTGSTAYSMAAGGPIIYPTLASILLTPICPHTLTNRPIILPVDSTVEVTLRSEQRDAYITLDGQMGLSFLERDVAKIQKSGFTVPLVKSPFKGYFEVLRTKLKWGER